MTRKRKNSIFGHFSRSELKKKKKKKEKKRKEKKKRKNDTNQKYIQDSCIHLRERERESFATVVKS